MAMLQMPAQSPKEWKLEMLKLAISDLNQRLANAPDSVRKSEIVTSCLALSRDTASQLGLLDPEGIAVELDPHIAAIHEVVENLSGLLIAASAGIAAAAALMGKITEQLKRAEEMLHELRRAVNLDGR